uniref:Uncharacterized protein n=1 Tax=Amphora coffeiformis TaxID=265554 RepID=A0A7S3P7I9_9STRA
MIGANPNVTDDLGKTPLHYAIRNSHLAIVKFLVSETGADTKRDAEDPFFHAVNFHADSFFTPSMLIDLGFCPWETDAEGNTALHFCVKNETYTGLQDDHANFPGGERRLQLIDNLIRRAPGLLEAKNHKGRTPLQLTCTWQNRFVERLVQHHDANLSTVDKFARTPDTVWEIDKHMNDIGHFEQVRGLAETC